MFGKVVIGGKEIELVANAATPYRYQAVFHEDYFAKVQGTEETDPNDFFLKVGYIMAMQAEKKDMSKCNFDSFLSWLSMFDLSEMFKAIEQIADVHNGNGETNSDPKDEAAQQTGE